MIQLKKGNKYMVAIRSPAVAGLFYPADKLQLQHDVQALLAKVELRGFEPKALIVPHAGYMYSGSVAAAAYANLNSVAAAIQRVWYCWVQRIV
jgi:AmmeMemoRadiSam system protein B